MGHMGRPGILPPQSRELIGTVGATAFAGKRGFTMRLQFILPLVQMVAP